MSEEETERRLNEALESLAEANAMFAVLKSSPQAVWTNMLRGELAWPKPIDRESGNIIPRHLEMLHALMKASQEDGVIAAADARTEKAERDLNEHPPTV